jgi:cytosine/adenosine deaminase-related metal-dependent hydrolase
LIAGAVTFILFFLANECVLAAVCSYQYTCTVPAVAARAAVALSTFMKSGSSTATSTSSSSEMDASSTQAEAEALIIRAHSACTQGVMDEAPSYLHELARAFEKLEEVRAKLYKSASNASSREFGGISRI